MKTAVLSVAAAAALAFAVVSVIGLAVTSGASPGGAS